MNFDELSPEIKERLKAAGSEEELLKIVAEAGVDLSNEELKAISGGVICIGHKMQCDSYYQPCVCYDDEGMVCEGYSSSS